MNVLPLVFALVMVIAILTVERMEKFKNHSIIQQEYQTFLKEAERIFFNDRQKHLFGESNTNHKYITFRFLYDKKARDKHLNESNQYRLLLMELMKVLYGEAAFFKELEKKRGQFLDELLTAVESAAEGGPKIRHIRDIARLKLEDAELQEAFYHMLKGTISREQLLDLQKENPEIRQKGYPSLFVYINNHGKKGVPAIDIGKSPRELLKAIFIKDEIVDEILIKRKELSGKKKESGSEEAFKAEFIGKRRPGIDELLLEFKLPSGDSSLYD